MTIWLFHRSILSKSRCRFFRRPASRLLGSAAIIRTPLIAAARDRKIAAAALLELKAANARNSPLKGMETTAILRPEHKKFKRGGTSIESEIEGFSPGGRTVTVG